MSEPYSVGLRYISYFLSDHFDNLFKSCASPIKVAFTAGLCIGVVLGYNGRNIRDKGVGFASGVKERLTWRSVSFQLDGDFKKAMEDMLEKVSPFFANDNDLFSGLRRFMNCQTEMAWGDVRGLMEAVAPSLMAGYNNRQLKVANFFSKAIEFLKDSEKVRDELDGQVNDLTRRCFEADILLLYAEDDSGLATEIDTFIQGNNSGISVKLVEDIGIGQPRLSGLDDVFQRYIYVCIIVNDNLRDDVLADFSGEMCLVNSLYNAKGRVIPVQTTDRRPEFKKYPVYATLNPWRYRTDRSIGQLQMLIQNASKTVFKKTNASE